MDLRRNLARSLRVVRKVRGFTHNDLSEVSGRTYVSEVERGIKAPTLEKLDQLARHMGVHPLTLLTMVYLDNLEERDLAAAQTRVKREMAQFLSNAEIAKPQKARVKRRV